MLRARSLFDACGTRPRAGRFSADYSGAAGAGRRHTKIIDDPLGKAWM